MQSALKLARSRTQALVRKRYTPIKVTSGKCRYNFRCQMNAVHEAIRRGDEKISMSIYLDALDNDTPIIHFLNVESDGTFVDNTLGEWSSQHEYFHVKYISIDDFFNVNHIFREFVRELRHSLGWLRFITGFRC